MRLPKLELKKFDGSIKKWLAFWAQFSKIHEDAGLKDEDTFDYLLQCLYPDSPAQKLIENLPPSKANYSMAIDLLKSRFGKDEFLIEYYVRELLSLVLRKNSVSSIIQLHDSLEAQLRAIESLGVTNDKYAAMLFPLVESALSDSIFKTWERHRVSKKASAKNPDECLTELLAFLKVEVEGEERLKLRENSFDTDLETTKPKKVKSCIFCGKSTHNSQDCASIVDSFLEKRQQIVKNKGGCFKCLRRGHRLIKCKVFVKCPLCKGKHYAIMCNKAVSDTPRNGEAVESVSQLAGTKEGSVQLTYLPTLIAKIQVGKSFSSVRVLCDSGSQRSYIKKSWAKQLNLQSIGKVSLRHELFGGHKTSVSTSDKYKITLKSVNSDDICTVEVLESDKIFEWCP